MSNETIYAPQDLAKAWQLINQANSVALLTHYNPDADGVSACAALAKVLEKKGKKVEAIYPTEPECYIKRQPSLVNIRQHTFTPDLLIACDTANYERLYYPEAFKTIPLINIDHHVSNKLQGTVNLVNPKASSTCEDLYLIIKAWDQTLVDQYIAECLLFGMLYDSQVFHTQATTPQTLRIAADLMEYGANLFELKGELLTNKNPEIIALWGKLLSEVKISPKGNAAWIRISQADLKQFGLTLTSLIGFSNFLWEIGGVDISIIFCETESGQTKVSLRSKTSDVNALAQKFGGGGHKNASGILMDKPLDQSVKEVTASL